MNYYGTLGCPFCGAAMPNGDYKAGRPIVCPSCSRRSRISRSYKQLTILTGIAVTAGICFVLNLHGLGFALGFSILLAPVLMIWVFGTRHIIPPKLEPAATENSGTKPAQ